MLTVENCIDYLRNNYFTDIHFTGEENGCLYFTAIDEDDIQKEVCFEYGDLETVIVSVRENKNQPFYILEKLTE
jgi:uncharacterized protein (DUF169 family)